MRTFLRIDTHILCLNEPWDKVFDFLIEIAVVVDNVHLLVDPFHFQHHLLIP